MVLPTLDRLEPLRLSYLDRPPQDLSQALDRKILSPLNINTATICLVACSTNEAILLKHAYELERGAHPSRNESPWTRRSAYDLTDDDEWSGRCFYLATERSRIFFTTVRNAIVRPAVVSSLNSLDQACRFSRILRMGPLLHLPVWSFLHVLF
jgi:hypothetical protein